MFKDPIKENESNKRFDEGYKLTVTTRSYLSALKSSYQPGKQQNNQIFKGFSQMNRMKAKPIVFGV